MRQRILAVEVQDYLFLFDLDVQGKMGKLERSAFFTRKMSKIAHPCPAAEGKFQTYTSTG